MALGGFELLVHVPGIRLPNGVAAVAGDARLAELACEEWLLLEDPVMDWQRERFRRAAPAFVRISLGDEGAPGAVSPGASAQVNDMVDRVSIASLLAWPGLLLPQPTSSVAYLVWRDVPRDDGEWFGPSVIEPSEIDKQSLVSRTVAWIDQPWRGDGQRERWVVERRAGPAEREWLVGAVAIDGVALAAHDVERFAQAWHAVSHAQLGSRTPVALRIADVLRLAWEPGDHDEDLVVQFVAVLEYVVNPEAARPLGETFARRAAALLGDPTEHDVLRELYALRSAVLHGSGSAGARALDQRLRGDGQPLAVRIRAWAWSVLRTITLAIIERAGEPAALRAIRSAPRAAGPAPIGGSFAAPSPGPGQLVPSVDPAGAFVALPIHGLAISQAIDVAGLALRELSLEQWRMLEATSITDQYADRYAERPRCFAVREIDASSEVSLLAGIAALEVDVRRFLEAMHLVQRGAIVEWDQLCPVIRAGAGNQRIVGPYRRRFWGSVFGEPLVLRGRRREFMQRIECRPLQAVFPHGPAYRLTPDVAAEVERWRLRLAEVRKRETDGGLGWVLGRFQRAANVMLTPRQRIWCLLSAFEALFGAFSRARGSPDAGAGAAVARAFELAGQDQPAVAELVERRLRKQRNRIAHGSDVSTGIDYGGTEVVLDVCVRIGLRAAIPWLIEQPPTAKLDGFRSLLGRPGGDLGDD